MASVLVIISSIAIGIANQQKILFRSEPLYPSDIHFVKDIKFLFEMIDFKLGVLFVVLLLLVVALFVVYFLKREKK